MEVRIIVEKLKIFSEQVKSAAEEMPTERVDALKEPSCCICHDTYQTSNMLKTRLLPICDTCFNNSEMNSKSEWIEKKRRWYKNCVVYNRSDILAHYCTCLNLFWCDCCWVCFDKKNDIVRHVSECFIELVGIVNDESQNLSCGGKNVVASRSGDNANNGKRISKIRNCVNYKNSKEKCNRNKMMVCKYCRKIFKSSFILNKHLRCHTREKPFISNYCKKRFSKNSSLKRHLLTHTGDKTFICNYCKKGFSKNSCLKTHLRSHTGQKSFTCNYCKKGFSHYNLLKRHLQFRKGKKSFTCKSCKKAFVLSQSLKRHVKICVQKTLVYCNR